MNEHSKHQPWRRTKYWLLASATVLVASVVALLAVSTYLEIGVSIGQQWGSLTGPEPVWPATVGYGAMNLALLSGAVFAVVLLITVVRALVATLAERRERRS